MEAAKTMKAEGYRLSEFMNLYFYKGLLRLIFVDQKNLAK